MALLPYLVFLGFIASGLYCEVTAECDATCASLKTYLEENKVTDTKYRLQYHVAPPIGWMNDPNGFIYYKGNYHIFYQFYPYESAWGPMHWGHSTSPDLVNWTTQPTALIPGTEQCFSGSAIVYGTTLVLMYTGHATNPTTYINDESQYLAFSDDGINFLKYENNPVLTYSPTGSPDFRDPKVWQNGNYYYVVLGSKTSDNRGTVRLYRSEDLLTWSFLKVIAESSTSVTSSAYMWECPDFFQLGGKYVLLMSPQGMSADGDRYKNLYQTGYILGSFNYETNDFVQEVAFQEIDYGHDFYATQTTERDGKRYLIAWFGMWDSTFPEQADGWAGALTIFRELQLSGDRIIMKPVDAMVTLRQTAVHTGELAATSGIIELSETGELIVGADWTQKVSLEMKGRTGGETVSLTWDPTTKKVAVTRDRAVTTTDDQVRQVEWNPTSSHTWRIFLDTSSVELFCGDGDVVFSSRVYPLGGWLITNLSDQPLTVEAYPLSRSVPE